MYKGWTQTDYQNKHYNINQKEEKHRTTKEEMEGPTSSWGSRNRVTCLTLQEHDDDDLRYCKTFWWLSQKRPKYVDKYWYMIQHILSICIRWFVHKSCTKFLWYLICHFAHKTCELPHILSILAVTANINHSSAHSVTMHSSYLFTRGPATIK